MLNINGLAVAALVVAGVALACGTISLATYQWADAECVYKGDSVPTVTNYVGLWEDCICQTSCNCLNYAEHNISLSTYMKVTQTGSCLATFFDIVAMVLLGIYAANVLSQESKKTILQFAIFTALGLSALWSLISVITFGTKHKKSNSICSGTLKVKFGYSWGLMVAVTFLNGASMVLTGLARRRNVLPEKYESI